MAKKRTHVWISGRVQGVFFRANTQEAAAKRDITGWVKNLPDGRVEAVFEGESDRVDDMLSWCESGSPAARVQDLEVTEENYQGNLTKFEIRY